MVGIVSFGGYVPKFRMERKIIAAAWNRGAMAGERSIANNDEDSITMAVEAACNCLHQKERESVEGLYFCSTTSPYAEKMNAALVAAAVDLRTDIRTSDYSNSLRSSTGALHAALDAVESGAVKNFMVAAADVRLGYPKSDQEQMFGDGGAAVLVGNENLVATYEGDYSLTDDMMDIWRNPDDKFVKQWEGRFVLGEGFSKHMKQVVNGIIEKYDLSVKDIAKIIFPAPDIRTHQNLSKALGFTEGQVQDPFLVNIGHCGAAHPLLMLCAAFENAKPGDLFLLAAYGDGADALLFRATELAGTKRNRTSVSSLIEDKMYFSSYARFLSYRGLLEAQPGEPFRLLPSATATWRERKSTIRCHASQCNNCGVTTFPIQRVCYNCRSKDDYREVRISDRSGKIFTFTRDNLAGRSDDPVIIQTVADLDGDVRFYGLMTDFDPEEIELGQALELTFRRIYDGAGFHNYFWKLRPRRKGGQN